MSTKTTFKRVALVAVAALGLGVLSVAPSQADPVSVSLTPSATTSAITTAETATITIAASAVLGASNDSLTVYAVVQSANGSTKGALEFRGTTDSTTTRISASLGSNITLDSTTVAAGQLVRGTVSLNLVKPTVKGTYSILVYTASKTAGTLVTTADKSFVWTVTVTSNSTDATTATTSFISAGRSNPGTADAAVFASKDATLTTPAATIIVNQTNATSSADEPLNVYITGPGYVVAGADTLTARGATRSIQTTGASQKYISVYSDGTAGASTITVMGSVTGTVLATKKVTFSDTKPAAIAVAVKKAYVAAGLTTAKTFAVTVTDATGNAVTDSVITGTRTDTTTAGKAIATAALTCGTYDSTDKVYYCSATGASSVVFGKAEYKITATGIDADATAVSAMASTTYSDIVATSATLTAPATANVGDKITYTLTLTEKNGYPVADSTYEGGSANGSIGGIVWNTTTVPTYTSTVKPFNAGETITTVSGVATVDVYVPSIAGTITNTWVLAGKSTAAAGAIAASIAGTTLTTTTVVTNPGVDAATDAANEATDAANAATDAALAAADAADAATAAAQDASDAVAALSASVSKLISSLRAQITSLTNLVIKIQKKVRA
jgi:trimeric autotransporter adhesin